MNRHCMRRALSFALLAGGCASEGSSTPAGAGGGGDGAGAGGTANDGGSVSAGATGGTEAETGGGSGGSAASAGGTEGEDDLLDVDPARHLGRPFRIEAGRIRADQNDYGLEASFFAVRDADETPIEVASLDGRICLRGELTRALLGDFDSYWGISFGFTVGPLEFRTLDEFGLSLSPEAPAWDLDGGQVIGIAATVTGSVLPNSSSFGMAATAGGEDPGGQYGTPQELTIHADCGAPPVSASGQVVESLFANLKNWWCIEGMRSRWTGSSVSSFSWGVGSLIVEEDAGETDAYDFCLEDIRPVLAGEGPDEPATLPDAGVATDAGAPDAAPDGTDAGSPDGG